MLELDIYTCMYACRVIYFYWPQTGRTSNCRTVVTVWRKLLRGQCGPVCSDALHHNGRYTRNASFRCAWTGTTWDRSKKQRYGWRVDANHQCAANWHEPTVHESSHHCHCVPHAVNLQWPVCFYNVACVIQSHRMTPTWWCHCEHLPATYSYAAHARQFFVYILVLHCSNFQFWKAV